MKNTILLLITLFAANASVASVIEAENNAVKSKISSKAISDHSTTLAIGRIRV